MKCKNCGLLLMDNEKSCYNCSTSIHDANGAMPNKKIASYYEVAKAQKMLIWSFVADILIIIPFMIIFVVIFRLVAIYNLAIILEKKLPFLWVLGALFPLVSLLLLSFLNSEATMYLRKAGIRVGFFGADLHSFKSDAPNE